MAYTDEYGHDFCDGELEPRKKYIVLPQVEIPESGISDWFEDGLQEIFARYEKVKND